MQRIRDLIEKAKETEAEEVYRLGKRLFFDRNGPIDAYGSDEAFFGKRTSPNEEPVDTNEPAILVNKLERSAKGCEWLRDQWEQLKAPLLEPEGYWVGCHRLMAIRLLGRQPVNAVTDRLVAEVFVGSFALKRDRVHAFADLLDSDLAAEKLKNLIRSAMAAWRGLAEIKGKSEGRAILLDIVEQNIERLDELIKGHAENAQNEEESQLRRLRVDDSPESHRLRTHKAKCQSALYRGHAACQNYKKSHGAGRRGGGREQWNDAQGALIKSTDGRGAARRAGLNNPDMSWAYEPGGPYHRETPVGHGDGIKPGDGNAVNSEHVIAARNQQDTTIRENEANFDEGVRIAQDTVAVDVMANSDAQSGLDTGGKANFGEAEFERVSDEVRAVLDRLSPVVADCPAGTEAAEVFGEHVIASREHQDSISGEIEANFDDHVKSAQEPVAVDVMANSDALSGLDTGGKANFRDAAVERVRDVNEGRDEVVSTVVEEGAEEGRQAEPASEKKVVVSDRRQGRRGVRRRSQSSKKDKKRLRRELVKKEVERRKAQRQKASEPRFEAILGGIEPLLPNLAQVLPEHGDMLRAP